MTNELQETLAARAERAATSPDAESWLQQIAERRQRQVKRRRVALAAGGSSLAVVAVAVSVVATSGSPAPSRSGGPSALPAVAAPVAPQPHRTTSRPAVRLPSGNVLVAAPRAPRNAATVLRLVPKGYDLVGVSGPATTYRTPKQDRDPNSFVGKVSVVVGDRYDTKTPAGRIAGYPAVIDAGRPRGVDDSAWTVRLYYSRAIEIDIQVPAGAGIGRALVRRMAGTIDIRDVSGTAHG